MSKTLFCTRFAPSPSGALHLGHAYAAWFCAEVARREGGIWRLRIEDIDHTRCRAEYEAAILDDLRWLGLQWQGAVWRQSERLQAYSAALAELKSQGLIYPCTCTRREVAAQSPGDSPDGPRYAGTCRRGPKGSADSPSWRLHMGRALERLREPLYYYDRQRGWTRAEPARFGDVVLARRDIGTAYHLAVVVDDAAQGIQQVVRGEDLRAATDLHRLLQYLLNLPVPQYQFHALVMAENGQAKLSKRQGAQSLAHYRQEGWQPQALIELACRRAEVPCLDAQTG